MYFKDAKVGDRVWDYEYGEGEIYVIADERIFVKFGKDNDKLIGYWDTGKKNNKLNQRLFYYDSRPIVITQDDLEIPEQMSEYSIFGVTINTLDKSQTIPISETFERGFDKPYTRKVRREEQGLDEDTIEEIHKLCNQMKIRCPKCKVVPKVFYLHPDFTFYHCEECGHEWWDTHKKKEQDDMTEEEKIDDESRKILEEEVNYFWKNHIDSDKFAEIYEKFSKHLAEKNFIGTVKIGEANGINRTRHHTQFECPNCSGIVNKLETYCKHCGVKFEWEDMHAGYDYE